MYILPEYINPINASMVLFLPEKIITFIIYFFLSKTVLCYKDASVFSGLSSNDKMSPKEYCSCNLETAGS